MKDTKQEFEVYQLARAEENSVRPDADSISVSLLSKI